MKTIKLVKPIIGVFILFLLSAIQLNAQVINGISYGTGEWERDHYGTQRAVIYVEDPADAVHVNVPWRRLDDVGKRNFFLVDGLTNRRIDNIYSTELNRDFGEFVFEPVSGEGTYYLYYMPSELTFQPRWWVEHYTVYEKPVNTCDENWKKRVSEKINHEAARTVEFQSYHDFSSFYPMEIPLTKSELKELEGKNQDKDFLIYPEDRNFPIRMYESIPYRWYLREDNSIFQGSALKDESYAWQIGIYAFKRELKDLQIEFTDLKSTKGESIKAGALKCINMGGVDHLGNSFTKTLDVPKGEVQALWIVTDINENQAAGTYKGSVTVKAHGTKEYQLGVSIKVLDRLAENRGYDVPQSMSRLNWLDSRIGIDDEVFAPFTPVELDKNTVKILGRSLSYNKSGFPARIISTFSESNNDVKGVDRDIIAEDIRLEIWHKGEKVKFTSSKPKITLKESGAVAWETTLKSSRIDIVVQAKMECDGYINYTTKVVAKSNVKVDDIKLVIPYSKSASQYLMGLGLLGGLVPDDLYLDWKWDVEREDNQFWAGAVNAGLNVKLKHLEPDWSMNALRKTGPYRDWYNEGKGGCKLKNTENGLRLTAFTGEKAMSKDEEMVLNFQLGITPFKPLDKDHWQQRYFHNSEVKRAYGKAKVINIHHANEYNPFINYPFLTPDIMKEMVNRNAEQGIKTKLYYTVRELTVFLPELWALRSLGDEIYTNYAVTMGTAHMPEDKSKGDLGHAWLHEHLRTRFNSKWHSHIPENIHDGWDFSIQTQALSRWLNYYTEGLGWLTKNIGIKGIYLDGIAYDREIIKRLRKTMDRNAEGCLMDLHAGNPFHGVGSNPALKYMELLPCVNSLWIGEGIDYVKTRPDYWLIEISGIPFGMYSEMLTQNSPAHKGMVYGMTNRFRSREETAPLGIWKLWDDFGMEDSEFVGYWDEHNPVQTNKDEVKASVMAKEDKILVAIGNWSESDELVKLDIDWNKLGFDKNDAIIDVPEIERVQEAKRINTEKIKLEAGKGIMLIISEK
jgi:hypothetical protein